MEYNLDIDENVREFYLDVFQSAYKRWKEHPQFKNWFKDKSYDGTIYILKHEKDQSIVKHEIDFITTGVAEIKNNIVIDTDKTD